MKLPYITVTIRTFYLMAIILFGIASLGKIYTTIHWWDIGDIGTHVSSIAEILLSFVWIGLFVFLYRSTPEMTSNPGMTNEDIQKNMDEILENVKKATR